MFKLHERKTSGVRTPIDQFFSSLADHSGRTAFCVVLSGTGSDGTVGLRNIKAKGGFAIVQDGHSARFPGMPDSAAATGLVDFILKPQDIPARLMEIADHRSKLDREDGSSGLIGDIEENLEEVQSLVDEETGHDFSDYKTGTIVRRIERRMLLLRKQSVQGFIELLKEDENERLRLRQDFLIGVTHFFRDPEFFDVLCEEVIKPILKSDRPRFRIWVPGCSTGEEVYSIAILMSEALKAAGDKRPFQVFGTDIDQAALSHARKGIYSDGTLENVTEKRLQRYFTRSEHGCQMVSHLRESCIFAPHNLILDPPFSRLDLISCRNLLIYLNAKIQKSIIPRFHYALHPSA